MVPVPRHVWKKYPAEPYVTTSSCPTDSGGSGGNYVLGTDHNIDLGKTYYLWAARVADVYISSAPDNGRRADVTIRNARYLGNFTVRDVGNTYEGKEPVSTGCSVPKVGADQVVFATETSSTPTSFSFVVADAINDWSYSRWFVQFHDKRDDNTVYYTHSSTSTVNQDFTEFYVKTNDYKWHTNLEFPRLVRKTSDESIGYATCADTSQYPMEPEGGRSGYFEWLVYEGSDNFGISSAKYKGNPDKLFSTVQPTLEVTLTDYTYQIADPNASEVRLYYCYSTDNGASWTPSGGYTTTTKGLLGPGKSFEFVLANVPSNVNSLITVCFVTDGLGYVVSPADLATKGGFLLPKLPVVPYKPPVINSTTGEGDLGSFGEKGPTLTYSVTDPYNKAVTVTEKVGKLVVKEGPVVLGESQTVSLDSDVEHWLQVPKGANELIVSANDGYTTVEKKWNFTRTLDSLSATFSQPFESAERVTMAVETLVSNVPETATIKVEVCNNGFDEAPTWEDVTDRVVKGEKFLIKNSTKTANKWGYNVRVTISRGSTPAETPITLSGFSGYYG